jgi:hypothetical protein
MKLMKERMENICSLNLAGYLMFSAAWFYLGA